MIRNSAAGRRVRQCAVRATSALVGAVGAMGPVGAGAVLVGAASMLMGAAPARADASAAAGATVFAERCAVCHGPQAAGIPGTFPSLHEQIVSFARTPHGRDYLVMVVTTGLIGGFKVNGISYNGAMPAQSGLSEEQVAAVLNYLASNLGANAAAAPSLSAADVAETRARHPDRAAPSTRLLRPAEP